MIFEVVLHIPSDTFPAIFNRYFLSGQLGKLVSVRAINGDGLGALPKLRAATATAPIQQRSSPIKRRPRAKDGLTAVKLVQRSTKGKGITMEQLKKEFVKKGFQPQSATPAVSLAIATKSIKRQVNGTYRAV